MMKEKRLRKGDIILLKPKVICRKLQDIPSKIIAKVNQGFTHVALYAGKGMVVHCDYKIGVISTKFSDFLASRKKYYGKIDYSIVRPRYCGKSLKKVFTGMNNYLVRKLSYSVRHLLRMLVFLVRGFENVVEPMVFDSFAVCSTFIARLLKEADVDIGKKASIAFMPVDFIDKKYFKVVENNNGGKAEQVQQTST